MRKIVLSPSNGQFKVESNSISLHKTVGSAIKHISELQIDFEDIDLQVLKGVYCITEKVVIPSNIHVNAAGKDVFTGSLFLGDGINANIIFYSGSSLSNITLSGVLGITVAGTDVKFDRIDDKRSGGHTVFPTEGRAEFTILEISEMEGFLRIEGEDNCYNSAGIDLSPDGTMAIGSSGGSGIAFSPSQTKAILDRLNAYFKEHVKEEQITCLTTENLQTMN